MTASSARAVSAEPRQAEEVVEDVADGGHGQGQVALAGEQVNWPDPAAGTMDMERAMAGSPAHRAGWI